MKTEERKNALLEWNEILDSHPTFGRVFLAQQVILMEASKLGYSLIEQRMCEILKAGLPVLFEDFWIHQCKQDVTKRQLGGLIGCLTNSNRDPAGCFGNDDEDSWFDDPLAGGKVLPPKPQNPPL